MPVDTDLIDSLGGGDQDKALKAMTDEAVAAMYSTQEANQFLEVTYQNGEKEVLYFKDFASGAMIENIVRRAKKLAIKRDLAGGVKGLQVEDLLTAVRQEFREHEDLPNTTNPDDWAKISGKKGERIVYVRTLAPDTPEDTGGRSIEAITTGQYLYLSSVFSPRTNFFLSWVKVRLWHSEEFMELKPSTGLFIVG